MKKRSLIVFVLTFILGIVAVVFGYYFLNTPQTGKAITVSPISLKITDENGGKRCAELRYDPASVNPLCYNLQEKLIGAAWDGNLEEIREALQLGANVNATYYQSSSAVFTASMKGHKDAVVLLVENGADVNKTEKWDQTPLTTALDYDQREIAKVLVDNNADVCNVVHGDSGDRIALGIARDHGDTEMASLLEEHGANRCFFRSFF